MKNYFVWSAIMIVGMLAFWDAKTRLDELNSVAATTPSQVEMKREIPKSTGEGFQQKIQAQPNQLTLPQSNQNNQKVQNLPQKHNAEFKDLNPPIQNQSP